MLSKYEGENFFVTAFNFLTVSPLLTDTMKFMQMGLGQCCQHMQPHEAVTLNHPSCVSVQAVQTCCARNDRAVGILGGTNDQTTRESDALG